MYTVARITDESRVKSFLSRDINYAAYALGDLDPPYAEYAQWIGAEHGGQLHGLALSYPVLDPPVLFLMGDESSQRALLTDGEFPARVYYTTKPEFKELIAEFYKLVGAYDMYRMRITADTITPVSSDFRPALLGMEHTDDINQLLRCAAEADSRGLDDIAFVPDMIRDGYYYGVFDRSRLIAAAGTHIVAGRSKIAAVGNVVVDPSERRKGLGTIVTQAVTQALLRDSFQLIVLNVRQNNTPALAAYRKLGYQVTGDFIEGLAQR